MVPLPHWEKTVHAERLGGRVVRVQCTMCGCEYFYVLTRIGKGAGTAPYSIGVGAATRRAQKQSQRDLDRRLAQEAELVPCPKCHWINDDLVRGFRLGCYRPLGKLAFVIGLVGTITSLIAGWFIAIGPPRDRAFLPYCLFDGPALFLSLAGGILLLRTWLRSRIQPNRDYPLAPKLPPGSPPALLRDESGGELRPAQPSRYDAGAATDLVDFRIGRDHLPPVCCDCLKSTPSEHGYGVVLTGTMILVIPRCADCSRLDARKFGRIWPRMFALGMLMGSAAVAPLWHDALLFWFLLVCIFIVMLALACYVASAATTPAWVAGRDTGRGVVSLRFRNTEYGALVAKHLAESSTRGDWPSDLQNG